MYGLRHDIENLEEQVQELESKQENAATELDYVLELLDPIGLDVSEFMENVDHARKLIKDLIKELG
jgi:polyhydroxyalkanoate synthesis regulator phasin